jgi:hypothetical protein
VRELEARVLAMVDAWHARGEVPDDAALDALAIDLFEAQLAANRAYRRFVRSAGRAVPRGWRDVPAVPASAFKDATLAAFEPRSAELVFHTSGTTAAAPGRHFMQRSAVYDAVLLAGFDRFMLADRARLAYLCLVPDPGDHPHSSLGYMMGEVSAKRGVDTEAFYLDANAVDVPRFCADLRRLTLAQQPVCIAGTAFGLVALLERLEESGAEFTCPPGSRIMETGGFKGRTRAVERGELYRRLASAFAIPERLIVAEYGMTELTSQYYDARASRLRDARIKVGPPWLRTLVVDPGGREVPFGETGFLRHIDLANVWSVIAVQTEDRGYAADGGFVLLGRDLDAPLRGCSLDAEDLVAQRG